MTLTLDLPPDLERQLAREAERRGQAVDDCARILLEERLAAASAQELSEEQQPGPAIQELSDLLGALDTLITRTEDYDEEFLAPTPSASDAAHALVSATYGREPR